jgi:hypothetical protein
VSDVIKKIVERPGDDEKKALLAAFILTNFGREALDAFVRQKKRRAALPDTRG